MYRLIQAVAVAAGLIFATGALAQTQPTTAATAKVVTATCKDGTSYSGTTKSGACSGHGGVKTWGAPATAGAKAGGGAGKVWANLDTKVYHCPGTQYYGKTKHGQYMTESAAKAGGFHAAQGKGCS